MLYDIGISYKERITFKSQIYKAILYNLYI